MRSPGPAFEARAHTLAMHVELLEVLARSTVHHGVDESAVKTIRKQVIESLNGHLRDLAFPPAPAAPPVDEPPAEPAPEPPTAPPDETTPAT